MSIFESMLLNYAYPLKAYRTKIQFHHWHPWLSGKSIGARYAEDLGSTPSECQVFYLFRCVHSSMQPLRSVGRSNFDKGRHNLTTLIQKSTYINESCYIYICIYIYAYIKFTEASHHNTLNMTQNRWM